MRHRAAPGALCFTGREDECAVSEALPVAGCSSCLPACPSAAESSPSHPSGCGSGRHQALSRGTLRSQQRACCRRAALQYRPKPICTAPAAFSQPLNPVYPRRDAASAGTTESSHDGPAAAREADFLLWMRKHLSLQGWGVDAHHQ